MFQILAILDNPIISTSAHLPDEEGEFPTMGVEKALLFDSLDNLVDIIIDRGSDPGFEVSTILDFTTDEPSLVRKGLGWQEAQEWLTFVV